MVQQLWPAAGVFLASVDDDVIILNLAEDRYDGLLDVGDALELRADGSLVVANVEVSSDLVSAGIAKTAKPTGGDTTPVPPRRELVVDLSPPTMDTLRAAIVLLTATLRFRGRSLSSLVSFRHPIRAPAEADETRLGQLVGAARAARPWIPFEGECLQRSFLLRAHLAAQGVATDWVFGVATWPFAAHCWLQVGDMVIGDRLSRVSRFTPIMRV